jgi:ACS family glucarate transporter-like MFS transporter
MGQLDPPPTRVRHGVMGFLCTLAFILYIDRICIGQAGTEMKRELGISNTEWGLVGVAFQIAYAVFEPTTGHWGDRYGSRRVLIRIVLWWSAFTALTGCVLGFSFDSFGYVINGGLLMLLAIRFLFGAGEAGALPRGLFDFWQPRRRLGLVLRALVSRRSGHPSRRERCRTPLYPWQPG